MGAKRKLDHATAMSRRNSSALSIRPRLRDRMQSMGLLYMAIFLVVAMGVAKAIATLFDPQPFCAVCAIIYMCGLAVALIMAPPSGPGNEFGPLGEFLMFYPIGLAFWLAGLVSLLRTMYYGDPAGRVRVAIESISGVAYLGPLVWFSVV